MNSNRPRRRRGVVLTPEGLTRLHNAIHDMESVKNEGKRYSLEELGDLIRIAPKTVSKVLDCQVGTDRRTLEFCFNAFDLELSPWDYEYSIAMDDSDPDEDISVGTPSLFYRPTALTFSGETVAVTSRFYIARPPLEEIAQAETNKPGGFLRVKATQKAGKTFFIKRILQQSQERGFSTVYLPLQLAGQEVLSSSPKFFRWFCANIAHKLGLRSHLDSYWPDDLGSLTNCTLYLQEVILKPRNTPLVLAIDNAHRLFEYPALAADFFALLQSWHQEAGESEIWGNLRQIITYSTELCIAHNLHQSPFHEGTELELPAFDLERVGELARYHGATWAEGEEGKRRLQPLVELLGGHPYLTRIALYHLTKGEFSLEDLFVSAPSVLGIYDEHLRFLLHFLLTKPEIARVFHDIVRSEKGLPVEAIAPVAESSAVILYQLQCLGLITVNGHGIEPRCELYRLFFREQLATQAHHHGSLGHWVKKV
jgi:AAA-like domain